MSTSPTTPRAVLYVGLAKTGTTYIQDVLTRYGAELAEYHVQYPRLGPDGMFRAVNGLTGRHERWGLTERRTAPLWRELCARTREFPGTTVLGHEVLAGARRPVIEKIRRDLSGVELSVVITARDLGRQIPAWWQERVKNEHVESFAETLDTIVAGMHAKRRGRREFWRAQDLGAVVRRWSVLVPPERLHVVVCPPPGSPHHLLWDRFAEAIELPPGAIMPTPGSSNPSLGVTETALLRQVNAALGDRLPQPRYRWVAKHYFAEEMLGEQGSRKAMTPAELEEPLSAITRKWAKRIRRRGYTVHGPLRELLPICAEPGAPGPDEVDPAEVAAAGARAIADLLVEVASPEPRFSRRARWTRGADKLLHDPGYILGTPLRRIRRRLRALVRPGR